MVEIFYWVAITLCLELPFMLGQNNKFVSAAAADNENVLYSGLYRKNER